MRGGARAAAGLTGQIARAVCRRVPPCAAMCCHVLPCAAMCCHVLPCAAMCCHVLPCAAVCCHVPPCAAMCRHVLPCAAMCHALSHTMCCHALSHAVSPAPRYLPRAPVPPPPSPHSRRSVPTCGPTRCSAPAASAGPNATWQQAQGSRRCGSSGCCRRARPARGAPCSAQTASSPRRSRRPAPLSTSTVAQQPRTALHAAPRLRGPAPRSASSVPCRLLLPALAAPSSLSLSLSVPAGLGVRAGRWLRNSSSFRAAKAAAMKERSMAASGAAPPM